MRLFNYLKSLLSKPVSFTDKQVVSKGHFKEYFDEIWIQIKDMEMAIYYQEGFRDNSGKITGDLKTYYRDGTLKELKPHVNGKPEGVTISYYQNGILESRVEWLSGYPVGKGCYWYSNGQLQKETEWAAPRVKEVLINYWDVNGNQTVTDGNGEIIVYKDKEETKLLYKELYKDGLLVKGVRYDNDGQKNVYERKFDVGEIMPEFPGGIAEFGKFISTTIIYPDQARAHHITGKVFVEFVVGADRFISDITITKGLGYGCDEEVIRMLKLMPRWLPGIQSERAVPVKYSLPVTFSLK
ncbi:energy transducer TonB [Xanthocytophaga flava]|uniref:energy transducer TonB n=1 Tax=Xanthocytophaga flava TaxID=3048013 RepID=UPI0028D8679C|nr:energy transducer TonB [Xanthocytophaga flavus]MDJ1466654.1 energy transducer TonB [Xanthocytophaga flavus]